MIVGTRTHTHMQPDSSFAMGHSVIAMVQQLKEVSCKYRKSNSSMVNVQQIRCDVGDALHSAHQLEFLPTFC